MLSREMLWRKMLGITGAAVLILAAVSAQATSHIRIVRLSYIDGAVQMSRANGEGLDRAILNSPVVEGSRLVTGGNGLAEVEFENNSTLRLGENTEVQFSQLLLNDSGDKVNEVKLVHGTIYFDTHRGKGDIDRVLAAGRTFILRHDSQLRFIATNDQVQAAVMNGELRLDNNSDFLTAKKKDTITIDASNATAPVLAKGFDELPLDRWNNERAAYQSAYAYNANGNPALNGVSYGLQDLSYYGAWGYVTGYGNVWQPYGAFGFAGWDPYMSGAWVFTPGFGYAWSSAYPWGWLPYHYGAWNYMPTVGWFWAPGRSFNGGATAWQPTTTVTNAPVGYKPPVAPAPVAAGPRPTVTVGSANISSMTYLPGGPVPPNFRSVITNHSGPTGVANPGATAQGGDGASAASASSRAVSNARQNGHVFATPAQRAMVPSMNTGGGYMPATSAPSGATMHSGSGMGRATTGTGHMGGTGGTSSGSHGGTSSNPK